MRSQMDPFDNFPGKLEMKAEEEDAFHDEFGPLNKRSRLSSSTSSSPPLNQWSIGNNEFPVQPMEYNPLNEPSPLGLRLRKSPSLLDLIQMRLSQGNASSTATAPGSGENLTFGNKKESRGTATATATAAATEKLKASNFAASVLRIGCWEFVSRYEGDLVAKCYFAKHKLVWEILEGGLKSKMEIQWSDIVALKAHCPDDGPGTLTVMLNRQPAFSRETNPQPRKHTLWQNSLDFTDGQASIHRQHFLQCPPGVLNKHFEKLIQCDTRLKFLSEQPEIVMESPYFDKQASDIEKSDELTACESSKLVTDAASPISSLDGVSSAVSEMSSMNFEQWDTSSSYLSKEAPSPSSVIDSCAIEGNGSCEQSDAPGIKDWEQLKVPGVHQSMSMTDLVNHIGNCISEHVTSGNIPSDKASECSSMLDDISQILLSDTHNMAASDEKSLMKRVNSLYSLLQDPASASSLQTNGENFLEGPSNGRDYQYNHSCDLTHQTKANDDVLSGVDPKDVGVCKQAPTISRIDSFGDLLLHLPRIASLSKLLFDIAEDDESRAR